MIISAFSLSFGFCLAILFIDSEKRKRVIRLEQCLTLDSRREFS